MTLNQYNNELQCHEQELQSKIKELLKSVKIAERDLQISKNNLEVREVALQTIKQKKLTKDVIEPFKIDCVNAQADVEAKEYAIQFLYEQLRRANIIRQTIDYERSVVSKVLTESGFNAIQSEVVVGLAKIKNGVALITVPTQTNLEPQAKSNSKRAKLLEAVNKIKLKISAKKQQNGKNNATKSVYCLSEAEAERILKEQLEQNQEVLQMRNTGKKSIEDTYSS